MLMLDVKTLTCTCSRGCTSHSKGPGRPDTGRSPCTAGSPAPSPCSASCPSWRTRGLSSGRTAARISLKSPEQWGCLRIQSPGPCWRSPPPPSWGSPQQCLGRQQWSLRWRLPWRRSTGSRRWGRRFGWWEAPRPAECWRPVHRKTLRSGSAWCWCSVNWKQGSDRETNNWCDSSVWAPHCLNMKCFWPDIASWGKHKHKIYQSWLL